MYVLNETFILLLLAAVTKAVGTSGYSRTKFSAGIVVTHILKRLDVVLLSWKATCWTASAELNFKYVNILSEFKYA